LYVPNFLQVFYPRVNQTPTGQPSMSVDHDTIEFKPVQHPSVWSPHDLADHTNWLVRLRASDIAELESAVEPLLRDNVPLEQITKAEFPLGEFGDHLREVRNELLHGRGFVQMRALPLDRLGRHWGAIAFWGIGLHIGDEFASQNKHGHLLGHVRDLGESRTNTAQRGPYSRETIPYHVDCCDIVGLCCAAPAKRGGESSVVSSGLIFNTLLEHYPEHVAPLMKPVYRDRRDEIPSGKEPWYAVPVFTRNGNLLTANIEPTYIGSVARHFEGNDPNSKEQRDAIAVVQRLADEFRFDVQFERGDIQFVHNHVIMHSRQAFEDFELVDEKRHLFRLWMLNHDGRALPDAFYERHGDRSTVRRPGGIVGKDTQLCAPLD
jgi:hypothetical protein